MKLTKFQHACFVVEKNGKSLVVDPGNISHDFIIPHDVGGIVITHNHLDHVDEARINAMLQVNPALTLIGHETAVSHFTHNNIIAIDIGQIYTIGGFTLRFFGGQHAMIAESIHTPPNVGVLIDERLYYPGDSFVLPDDNSVIRELALPISAPWLKVSEAMELLKKARPQFAFPTHDGILSDDGKIIFDRLFDAVASKQQTIYKRLDGTSITL